MAPLTWGDSTPPFAYGLDRGVIHSHATDEVLPWNGLIEVSRGEDQPDDAYSAFEGVTYLNSKFGGFYSGEVRAYGFPESMLDGLGRAAALPGFYLTGQPRTRFDFAYRIRAGEEDYKLHFVWNALFSAGNKTRTTIDDRVRVVEHRWKVSATPPRVSSWNPTAFLTVDSLTASSGAISDIEDMLYGTDISEPSFPTQTDILVAVL